MPLSMFCQRGQKGFVGIGLAGPGCDRALLERERFVRDHPVRIKDPLDTQSRTIPASAMRTIERKCTRLDLGIGNPAIRTSKLLRKDPLFPCGVLLRLLLHGHNITAITQCRLERIGEALGDPRLDHESVHHHIDGVLVRLFQNDLIR